MSKYERKYATSISSKLGLFTVSATFILALLISLSSLPNKSQNLEFINLYNIYNILENIFRKT